MHKLIYIFQKLEFNVLVKILVCSFLLSIIDFSAFYSVGKVLSALMESGTSINLDYLDYSISLDYMLIIGLMICVLRLLLGYYVTLYIFKVLFNYYHVSLVNHWNKSTSSLQDIRMSIFTKKLQKVFNTDINYLIGGVITPAVQIMNEVFVIMIILIFIVSHYKFNVSIDSLVICVILLISGYWYTRKNRILGEEKNIYETKRVAFLSNFEKNGEQLYIFGALRGQTQVLKDINQQLSNGLSLHSTYVYYGRSLIESVVIIGLFIFILMHRNEDVVTSSFDWGLISVFVVRLLPSFSKIVQNAQTMSHAVPPAYEFLMKEITEVTNLKLNVVFSEDGFINISNAKFRFQKMSISVKQISLPKNSAVHITGPSGGGKSTVLSSLYDSLVRLDAKTLILTQNAPLLFKNLHDYETFFGQEEFLTFKKFLEKLNLDAVVRSFELSNLSGGEVQRLNLACILSLQPSILLLDEPISALDVKYAHTVKAVLSEYIRDGGLLFYASHQDLGFSDSLIWQVTKES